MEKIGQFGHMQPKYKGGGALTYNIAQLTSMAPSNVYILKSSPPNFNVSK